jgi:hypothetical protein
MRFKICKLEDRIAPSGFYSGKSVDISHTDHTVINIDGHVPRSADIDISHTDHTFINIEGRIPPGADINISHTDHTIINIG